MITPEIHAMIHTALATFVTALLGILGALATNWYNAQMAKIKNDGIRSFTERLVAYAEQKLKDNLEKNNYVANAISAKFPELTPLEVQHFLEAAVVNLPPTNQTTGATK